MELNKCEIDNNNIENNNIENNNDRNNNDRNEDIENFNKVLKEYSTNIPNKNFTSYFYSNPKIFNQLVSYCSDYKNVLGTGLPYFALVEDLHKYEVETFSWLLKPKYLIPEKRGIDINSLSKYKPFEDNSKFTVWKLKFLYDFNRFMRFDSISVNKVGFYFVYKKTNSKLYSNYAFRLSERSVIVVYAILLQNKLMSSNVGSDVGKISNVGKIG